MTGETQARRRKDKKKARKDSATDHSDSEEIKDHSESGGTSCLTLLVFLILTVGICVLGGLVYVHTISVPHVPTPPAAPKPAAEPIVNTIIETVVEVPAEEASESQPDSPSPRKSQGAAEEYSEPSMQAPTTGVVTSTVTETITVDEHTVHHMEVNQEPVLKTVVTPLIQPVEEQVVQVEEERLAEIPDPSVTMVHNTETVMVEQVVTEFIVTPVMKTITEVKAVVTTLTDVEDIRSAVQKEAKVELEGTEATSDVSEN